MSTAMDEQVELYTPQETRPAHAEALAAIERYDAAAGLARGAKAAAQVELEEIEAGAGAAVLDAEDGAAGEAMTAAMARLAATVTIQGKVAAEAEVRAEDARSRLLLAEADELDDQAAEVRVRLEAHQGRVAAALERLAKVSGMDWRPVTMATLIDDQRAAQGSLVTPVRWQLTPEELLSRELERIERTSRAARITAADRAEGARALDVIETEDWPESIRSGVVVVPGLRLPPASTP